MGWPGPMTHRQFEAWQSWLDEDMNRPSKDNYYQMQTTDAVQHVIKSGGGDLNKLKISFKTPGKKKTKKQREAEIAMSKSRTRAALQRKKDGDGT
jgi:hypothetical protein